MKKIVILLVLITLSSIYTNTLFASHLLGADLTFSCLGPGQYNVTLTLYRDCNGITPASSQTLSYSSSTCGVNGSTQLSSQGTPVDITPLCPGEPSACSGNGQWGVQRYIYTGTINLPPGCGDDWILGWSQCCRNGAINTLSGPSSQNMYVGTLLDNTVSVPACNSSPVFNNPPGSIVCVNQPVVYNHAVSDADGDSLYFSLGNCFEANGDIVDYSGGFNGTTPLSTTAGITVNPATGAIAFTPNQQQVGVLCVNVKEYRNGDLISEINRDMQFTVINCSNQPPQATGVDGTPNSDPVNFETSVCANGDLCFDINGTDPNGNNVTMSWNNEIIGATFTVANNGTPTPIATFCWNPGTQDIGQHVFSVNVRDDACPIIGSGTYTYIIDVLPSPNILDAGPNDTICFGDTTTLTATSTPAALSYTWTPVASLSSSSGATVQAFPFNSTTYEVAASFPDGCDLTDVVTIGVAPNPNVSIYPQNSFNCSGQATDLSATQSASYSYNWSPGPLPNAADITVFPTSTTTYTVEVTESNFGCSSSDTAVVVIAAPGNNVCNVLYVSPTGLPSNDGTKASPLDLETAMEVGACNGTTIKMAIGDYVTDTVINRVTSYLTLEGGFDEGTPNWDKISTLGATRILRTATQSYSTATSSIVTGNGVFDETGPNPEVVAIRVNNQTGFRFQDLTIESELNSPGTQYAGYEGVDVVGLRLDGCDSYNIVRTQIIADDASPGADQIFTIPATNGGNSYGLEIISNGATGVVDYSRVIAGSGGTGGTGTPPGTNGAGNNIFLTGTALATNNSSFNLGAQPTIIMDDIACTATNINFSQTNSGNWTFDSGSMPANATGANVVTMYNATLGRKNITYNGEVYEGFANILLDAQVLPEFNVSAPIVNGQHRICAGEEVNFTATNGGTGYIYHWDLGGGATPNNYDGVAFESLQNIQFNTPGIYTIELRFETSCCGLSLPTTIDLYVEERPVVTMPPDADLCIGGPAVSLTAGGLLPNGTVNWSPSSGLDFTDVSTVNASPGDTTTYNVTMVDSSGLCSNVGLVTINVVNIDLSTNTVDATCGPNGSATVIVNGGSGNYSYEWDDPSNQTTATATGLQVGNYGVVVTDNVSGCQDSIVAVVNPQPGSLVGFISNTQNVSCIGSGDGSLTVSVNGGTAPFSYSWSPAGGSQANTTNTSHTTTLLPGGTYTVTITDANTCEYVVDGFIAEPDSIRMEIDSVVEPSCLGATDGFLSVFADGGVAPLSVVWDDPNSTIGQELTNVGVGTYCASVADVNGCSDTICFTIDAPIIIDTLYDTLCQFDSYTLPSGTVLNPSVDTIISDSIPIAGGCDDITVCILTVNALPNVIANTSANDVCEPASITLTGSGADTYTWSNGVNNGVAFNPPTGSTDYIVTGTTTATGCSNTDTITITINPLPTVLANASPNDTLCIGEQLTLTGSGADTYIWSNGVNDGTAFVPSLGTATYTVTGTDTNGCVNDTTITILVNPNPVVSVNVSPNDSICGNSQITLSGTGATTYIWDNGVIDNNPFTISSGSSTYEVIGTDDNGCRDTTTQTVFGYQSYSFNDTVTICEDESYTLTDGTVVSAAGTYTSSFTTVGNGCDSIYTTTVNVNNLLEFTPLEDVTVCSGLGIELGVGAQNVTNIEWFVSSDGVEQSLLGNPNYLNANSDTLGFNLDVALHENIYIIEMIDECGNVTRDSMILEVFEPRAVENGVEDTTFCLHEIDIITVNYNGFNYEWNDGTLGSSILPNEPGEYIVTFEENNTGCILKDTIIIDFEDCISNCVVLAPTGFSPNGDGSNDEFRVVTSCEEGFSFFELRVYNRWGELVFITEDWREGWNGFYKGRDAEVGTYTYYVDYTKNVSNERGNLSGNVTLVR